MGKAGIVCFFFNEGGKNGSKCIYFKACLLIMFTENKKHYLVFGRKALDSCAVK